MIQITAFIFKDPFDPPAISFVSSRWSSTASWTTTAAVSVAVLIPDDDVAVESVRLMSIVVMDLMSSARPLIASAIRSRTDESSSASDVTIRTGSVAVESPSFRFRSESKNSIFVIWTLVANRTRSVRFRSGSGRIRNRPSYDGRSRRDGSFHKMRRSPMR